MFCHRFIICFFPISFILLFHNLLCIIVFLVKYGNHFDRKKVGLGYIGNSAISL